MTGKAGTSAPAQALAVLQEAYGQSLGGFALIKHAVFSHHPYHTFTTEHASDKAEFSLFPFINLKCT